MPIWRLADVKRFALLALRDHQFDSHILMKRSAVKSISSRATTIVYGQTCQTLSMVVKLVTAIRPNRWSRPTHMQSVVMRGARASAHTINFSEWERAHVRRQRVCAVARIHNPQLIQC